MRFLSLNCLLLLIITCILMQPHSVTAKPFIFKYFVPQAPARTDSSSSSSSSSSPIIDFGSILSAKLNILTSLLRTGLSSGISGGFNFGFKNLLPTTQVSSTRRPYTSTTVETPTDEFEPESTTKSDLKTTTTPTTTSTTTTETTKTDKTSGSDNLSEPIDDTKGSSSPEKATTDKNLSNNNVLKITTEKIVVEQAGNTNDETNGYDYNTSKITTVRNHYNGYNSATSKEPINGSNGNNGYDYTASGGATPQTGYNYDYSNQAMSENEISNEVMAISNQYLPAF